MTADQKSASRSAWNVRICCGDGTVWDEFPTDPDHAFALVDEYDKTCGCERPGEHYVEGIRPAVWVRLVRQKPDSGRSRTCLNCQGDREDAPRPGCYAPEEHDDRGRRQACQCPMTWGCKNPATRGDGLCDECRAECSTTSDPARSQP